MKQLFTGIYTLYNATNTLKSNTTDLYLYEAKQEAAMPYVVYQMVADTPDYNMAEDFREVVIQFNIYSDAESATQVTTLLGYLETLYDDATLTVTGYSHVHMTRTLGRLLRDTLENVWQYTVQYDVLIKKN